MSLSGLVASLGSVTRRSDAVHCSDWPMELLTVDWVHWYNTDRFVHRLGRIPPIEYEAICYVTNPTESDSAHQQSSRIKPEGDCRESTELGVVPGGSVHEALANGFEDHKGYCALSFRLIGVEWGSLLD